MRSLADACGVSRRTIFRDLDSLRSAEVPLVFDEERQVYSIPSQFFLAPTQFTPDEALAVVLLCHELGSDARLPFLAEARSAAVKIENTLSPNLRARIRLFADAVQIRLPAVAKDLERSRDVYQRLLESIADSRCVRIGYRSYSENSTLSTKLSPYRMVFHHHSWYVVGRSSWHAEVRTFNLGRIESIETLEETFEEPQKFSIERYFGNAWRIIPEPGPDREVVVKFRPLVAHNVAEVQWHPTQVTSLNDDGTLIFKVTVSGLREISWWILGYGDQAEILEPEELRSIVASHVRGMYQTYSRDLDRLSPT